MDYFTYYILFSFILIIITYGLTTISGRRNSRLPPGPFPLPIIGNLLHISDKPHHSLATLANRYGPLMSLKLGSRTTIVVSSPDMAKEFFQKHDQSFSGRPSLHLTKVANHVKHSILWLPAGDQWRRLRRICKEYLFSSQRLDASECLRQEKVKELIEHVHSCTTSEKTVNIGGVTFTTILNIFTNFIFSMDLAEYDSMSSQEFKNDVRAVLEISGKPNMAELFPFLEPFDPQGIIRHGSFYVKNILAVFDRIIDQRMQTRSSSGSSSLASTNNDVLDSLLNLNKKDEFEFDRNDIRHLFFALFVAGIDTTSATLEWAMTELIHNPEKLKIARSEINKVMKDKTNIIQESDISQLPYLQAIIKETLRLHPPAPFLIPHQSIQDVEVQGFLVPKDAQILCNVWAMGRDPKVWPHPETFMPERFLEVKIDYKGQDFELIPFGAGRRICPGLNVAHRMLHTMLASLIHKFDWKLEGNMKPEDLNREDKFGVIMQSKVPLKLIPLTCP
ncbi:hypothetical protein R6Q57_027594 [Mikania cordata]